MGLFDKLYQTEGSLQRRFARAGGSIVTGRIMALIFVIPMMLIYAILDELSPSSSAIAWLRDHALWFFGALVLAYFFYSFSRLFFEATTANSEAEAKAFREGRDV
jgi:hypothetical protein